MRVSFILLLATAAAILGGRPAHAGPLIIAPTTVEIAPDRQSAMLTVTNDSDDAADLQLRAYAWSQTDTVENLVPTGDLVISPAVVTVAPHKKQVFRILRIRTTQASLEPSYRLRLNELPRPRARGVVVNLEFSLPVFVTTSGNAPRLAWSREGATVSVVNTGNRHVRLGSLALADNGRIAALGGASSVYILAGARKTFALSPANRSVPPGAHLVGTTDYGPIDVPDAAIATR